MYNQHGLHSISKDSDFKNKMHSFVSIANFRLLSEANPENLPAGSGVILYDIVNDYAKVVVCKSFEKNGLFSYMHKLMPQGSWTHALLGDKDFKDYLYKII